MGRAPCCEKMGLKRGPWTPEEDQILIHYINTYGHANWRALPKQAGLLRCGKSCRLRWINYLRPDIKRGNITKEEEDAIINLHEMLGNRWSAIAARLPGRTDNEIKNVWHTHLKKRLPENQQKQSHNPKRSSNKKQSKMEDAEQEQQDPIQTTNTDRPQCSSSDTSSFTTSDNNSSISNATTNHDMSENNNNNNADTPENNLALDEDFWSEVLSSDNSDEIIGADYDQFRLSLSPLVTQEEGVLSSSSTMCHDMDFWYNIYSRAEELTELLEL